MTDFPTAKRARYWIFAQEAAHSLLEHRKIARRFGPIFRAILEMRFPGLSLQAFFVRAIYNETERSRTIEHEREKHMCLSCGCRQVNNDHGDSRNITLHDLDQAALASGTTRERVIHNLAQGEQLVSDQATSASQSRQGHDYEPLSPVRESGRQPGELSPQLGQESGTAWQESLQMGQTGHGGVQNPQTNP